MDWWQFLQVFNPEWIVIAILVALAFTLIWHIIDIFLGLEISDTIIFLILFGVIIFLKIENWYDVVAVVKGYFGLGVMTWMH